MVHGIAISVNFVVLATVSESNDFVTILGLGRWKDGKPQIWGSYQRVYCPS